ncbi:MAG: two-component regulator propeller domain-containing protein, partial [Bacteroidota bacterium]
GDGLYRYDGTAFQHFTTEDGLLSNEVVCIYQDRAGDLWLGMNGGVSHYNGQSFRNYVLNKDSIAQDKIGYVVPNLQRPSNEVNAIIEDQAGNMWFGTRGKTFIYDGQTFETVTHDGRAFQNVRWIIEDRAGNIWLGGNDGLWRSDGKLFTNITRDFTGYIYEDSYGNIWTSSQSILTNNWILSRYDEKSLQHQRPIATQITSNYQANQGMIFGISEAPDGSIWFGALDGVYRYDGIVIIKVEDGGER